MQRGLLGKFWDITKLGRLSYDPRSSVTFLLATDTRIILSSFFW
uniref:Uncharacterized protein n=1 Tax=Rhodnius prolixus TaxID=13249 RepID=A0A905R0D6_RHOPR